MTLRHAFIYTITIHEGECGYYAKREIKIISSNQQSAKEIANKRRSDWKNKDWQLAEPEVS